MPRPRKYPTNAARQAAYRARLKRREAEERTDGRAAVTARVLAADAAARAQEA